MNRALGVIECATAGPQQLMPANQADLLATLLKAMADPVRLRLLLLIAQSPDTTACACHLPTALGIAQPTLSHHLKKLVDAGLLVREQRGRWAHYQLSSEQLMPLQAFLQRCH